MIENENYNQMSYHWVSWLFDHFFKDSYTF